MGGAARGTASDGAADDKGRGVGGGLEEEEGGEDRGKGTDVLQPQPMALELLDDQPIRST